MLWNKTLISTLRDDPQEAEIPSHKLMMRAGLINKLSAGLYTFMPLGLKALRKVEAIIREEMDRAGALEVLMPALQPREIWERSGRYEVMGPAMFRLKDRQERSMVLGPTHEEVITDLAAHEIKSYRQLPKTLYQIQTKFRDEIRPRFGLMRAKEFIMKDAYSFDVTMEEADASYQAMYDAYRRIFKRCGLRTKIVEADTGAMGGKWSHEFMVLADSGEDSLVECEACQYAANVEKAERAIHTTPPFENADKLAEEVATPGLTSVEEVAGYLKSDPIRLIKTMIYIVNDKPVAMLIDGDRQINEQKLIRFFETVDIRMADAKTIQKVTNGPVGFSGPVGLNIPIYADLGLRGYKGAITGANRQDTHLLNVDLERDAKVDSYVDMVLVRDGDSCPKCSKKLVEKRGIEVGHVFKLGTKYTEAFGADYLDEEGARRPMIMGCYGIGVTRTLQAVIEQSHDDKGIIWPVLVAPYEIAVLLLDPSDKHAADTARKVYQELSDAGIDVIIDDRDDRPGVKFNDADLIGFPIRVIIGRKALASGNVEIKTRCDGKAQFVGIDAVVKTVSEMLAKMSALEDKQ